MIFKDAYFSFKNNFILPTCKLLKSGDNIFLQKRGNNVTAVQCTDSTSVGESVHRIHGVADCFCHGMPDPLYRMYGHSTDNLSPCMFPSTNLLDTNEEEVTKLPWNPSTCDLHPTVWNILNIMGFP